MTDVYTNNTCTRCENIMRFVLQVALVSACALFIVVLTSSHAQAQTHAQTRWLVYKTWGIRLSKSQVDALFETKYKDVHWQDVIEGVAATDKIVKELNKDRPVSVMNYVVEAAKKGAIKQGLKRVGLAGGASAVDAVFAVDKFRVEADKRALAHQMKMYFQAREGGLTKDQITNKIGEMVGDQMNYSDDGWMIGTDGRPNPIRRHGNQWCAYGY